MPGQVLVSRSAQRDNTNNNNGYVYIYICIYIYIYIYISRKIVNMRWARYVPYIKKGI